MALNFGGNQVINKTDATATIQVGTTLISANAGFPFPAILSGQFASLVLSLSTGASSTYTYTQNPAAISFGVVLDLTGKQGDNAIVLTQPAGAAINLTLSP